MKREKQTDIYETINYKKTKNAVQQVIKIYKLLTLRLEETKVPMITGKYGLTFGGNTNSRKSNVESMVIRTIILENKIEEYLTRIVNAFNKLEDDERKYLYYKFFDPSTPTDEQIIQHFNRYDYGFRLLKKEAYIKFAIIMCVEVYN